MYTMYSIHCIQLKSVIKTGFCPVDFRMLYLAAAPARRSHVEQSLTFLYGAILTKYNSTSVNVTGGKDYRLGSLQPTAA